MDASWFLVGKIKDAHGIRGELYFLSFSGSIDWASPQLKKIRLTSASGDHQIKLIKKFKPHKKGLIIKFEGVNSRNDAELLKGLMVDIPQDLVTSEPGDSIFLREVDHFSVFNSHALVGQVVGFSTNTIQDLIVVRTEKGDFDIPFIEEFIESIDYKEQKIFMKLPYGLIGEDD